MRPRFTPVATSVPYSLLQQEIDNTCILLDPIVIELYSQSLSQL